MRTSQARRGRRAQAVLYARVSSKDQAKEGFSITAQHRLLREYAREKSLRVVGEYVDVETVLNGQRAQKSIVLRRQAE